ncbi:FecR domain-containing protein [Polyangium jinanense]|uniref:FecR domain-containing protein n=1 Tax=Polyangium jinanense TaxID=2829994 RepID=A0A9X4AQW0_9BACT|nr:FecR domain-containing protein [Polyangium jinanense]MDC3955187.1 FecR domain-containing protein [Polyangium jinanense]MDC3981488.1 FecR domain-containing protein [Polyangium jinanense]
MNLVEALRDGRLGPQEAASMERHLKGCAVCTGLARDLHRIGDAVRAPRDRVTPLSHQRARVGILERATALPTPGASFEKTRLLLAAATLTMAVALGFFGGKWSAATNRIEAAQHMTAPPRLQGASEPQLRPSDDARFTRNRSAGLDEVILEDGALDVAQNQLGAGERFVVRTKDAQIEVRATTFRVEAKEGRILRVAVEQGTAEVQYAGFTAVIPAGGSWRATDEAFEKEKPVEKAAPDTTSSAVVPSAPAKEKTSSRAAVVRGNGRPPERFPEAPSESASEESPEAATPPSAPTFVPPPPARVPSAASRAFADAMDSLRRGDYAAGADKFEWFVSTYPADARADEADYLRAVALQRAGRTAEAVAAAKRYLATRPKGAHRADAQRMAGN